MIPTRHIRWLAPFVVLTVLAGCRDLNSEYFVPVGHPADPAGEAASPIGIPPLEPTSEDVRPKIPLASIRHTTQQHATTESQWEGDVS